MELNIYQVLILLGVIHGLVFAGVVIFHKKYKSKANTFLALTVLSLVVSNGQYWLRDLSFLTEDSFRFSTDFLILPMFFLFVNSYLEYKTKYWVKIVLIIPFILSLVLTYLFYEEFVRDITVKETINNCFETLSFSYTLGLIILIFYRISVYEKSIVKREGLTIKTKWIKQILILGFCLSLFWIIQFYYIQTQKNNNGLQVYYPLWIGISILIYWIAYVAVFQKHVFKERKVIRANEKRNDLIEKPAFSPELFSRIDFFIKNKNYKNPEMSLDLLAAEFDKTNSYISQIINKNTQQSFTDYINSLRIEKAKELLMTPEYNKYTITTIALESGFKSKSSFYTAFKKFTKMTPTQYKDVPNL